MLVRSWATGLPYLICAVSLAVTTACESAPKSPSESTPPATQPTSEVVLEADLLEVLPEEEAQPVLAEVELPKETLRVSLDLALETLYPQDVDAQREALTRVA